MPLDPERVSSTQLGTAVAQPHSGSDGPSAVLLSIFLLMFYTLEKLSLRATERERREREEERAHCGH